MVTKDGQFRKFPREVSRESISIEKQPLQSCQVPNFGRNSRTGGSTIGPCRKNIAIIATGRPPLLPVQPFEIPQHVQFSGSAYGLHHCILCIHDALKDVVQNHSYKPGHFSPSGSGLVRRSDRFSWVLTYAVCHFGL
jgi:hypothetical protein